ncbi:hypothetical protein [Actinopolymorpha alba]|uniref:hypothetical protein n=1 Tax=Actinopolymorpha alba TaxID=533267 RepID=UPI0003AA9291|nr:hypothetical protein [Actinopolymorpha alba]
MTNRAGAGMRYERTARSGRLRGSVVVPRLLARGVLVGAMGLALATAGCVSMPEARTGKAAPAWSPASEDATKAFLKRHDEISNKARLTRNPDLARAVESGPLLRASSAAFLIARRLDPKNKKPAKPLTHDDPQVYLPKFDNYPVWFVAVSQVAQEGRTAVDLVARSSAGSPWKKAQSVELDEDAQLPALAMRDGAAIDVSANPGDTLVRPPAKVAIAYAVLLQDGPTAPQAKVFLPSPDTQRAHQAAQQNARSKAFSYSQSFDVTSMRALATKDGGALVLFTMAETERLAMRDAATLQFRKEDAVAAYTGLDKGTAFLRTTWVWQVAAVVPATGQGDGKVRLLGVTRSLAEANMK